MSKESMDKEQVSATISNLDKVNQPAFSGWVKDNGDALHKLRPTEVKPSETWPDECRFKLTPGARTNMFLDFGPDAKAAAAAAKVPKATPPPHLRHACPPSSHANNSIFCTVRARTTWISSRRLRSASRGPSTSFKILFQSTDGSSSPPRRLRRTSRWRTSSTSSATTATARRT